MVSAITSVLLVWFLLAAVAALALGAFIYNGEKPPVDEESYGDPYPEQNSN